MSFQCLDNETKSPQSTWTSLDLLGNRGKRNRSGSDPSPKPSQENHQFSDDPQTRLCKLGVNSWILIQIVSDSRPRESIQGSDL